MLHFNQKTPLHCISLCVSHCTLLVTSSLAWLVTHSQREVDRDILPSHCHCYQSFQAGGRGRGHVECHNKYEKWHCDGPGSMGPSKDQSYAKWTHLMVIYYHTSRSENKNINISFSSSFPIIVLCPALTYFKTSWLIFVLSYSVFEVTVHHKKVSWNVGVQGLNH